MGSDAADEVTVLTFEKATPAAVAALLDPRPPDRPPDPPAVSGYRWTELRSLASSAGVGAEIGEIRRSADWEAAPSGPPLRVVAVKEGNADVIRFATTAALDQLKVGAVHGALLGRGDDSAGVRVGGLYVDKSAREVWVQPTISGVDVG